MPINDRRPHRQTPPTPLFVWLLIAFVGCAQQQTVKPKEASALQEGARIQTADAAIDVVRRAIKRRGLDPGGLEFHATWQVPEWSVQAWRIQFRDATGASRFVPGGFTTYIVSSDGKILRTMGGM